MEHYIGEKLPDKYTHQTLLDIMTKNVIQTITNYINAGFSTEEAIAKVRTESCAGSTVWEKVLNQF